MLRRLPVIALLLLVAACATVPRGPALTLAEAGQQTSEVAANSFETISNDVGLKLQRQLVRSVAVKCAPEATQCDAAVISEAQAAQFEEDQALAKTLQLRARAITALGAAYKALGAEARYDAPGELEAAVSSLFGSVNAFASAVALPTAPLDFAGQIVAKAAAVGAARAQTKRLVQGSVMIREANARLAAALEHEAATDQQIADTMARVRKNLIKSLIDNGCADPMPFIAEFEKPLGLAPPATLTPPRAEGVALTLIDYDDWVRSKTATNVYAANIEALAALREQHVEFEKGAPLTLDAVIAAMGAAESWAAMYNDRPR